MKARDEKTTTDGTSDLRDAVEAMLLTEEDPVLIDWMQNLLRGDDPPPD